MSPAPLNVGTVRLTLTREQLRRGSDVQIASAHLCPDHVTNFLHRTRILILKHINNYW
jgi:hypothetical protein